jgi:hypothetical protein
VGWALPNIAARHHLAQQADRARHADLPWYGLPSEAGTARSLGGMSGFVGSDHTMRASEVSVRHAGTGGESLHVTVCRRSDGGGSGNSGVPPLARLALPLVRGRDGFDDPRWAPHTVDEFHQAQQRALAELVLQPLDVQVDGVLRTGEMVCVGDDWAGVVPMPAEEFDLELTGHGWPTADLALVAVDDLEPYIVGARGQLGPLLLPRRPRLPHRIRG